MHALAAPARLALAALLLAPAALATDDEADALHRRYGFDGLIVSKFNDGLFGLAAGDVDGDGHGDLVVVNNGKAKLELLLHRDDAEPSSTDDELVNALPDEAWFERAFLATEQRIWALALGDLDADGADDLITLGDAGELRVAFLDADGALARSESVPLEDTVSRDECLAVGDLDKDGLLDVAVLTKRGVELVLQQADGSLRADTRLPHGGELASALELVDLDGDGFLDVVGVFHENDWPLRVRRGHVGGRFGPELRIPAPELRSHTVADLDGDGRAELVGVGRKSGRALVLRLVESSDDDGSPLGPPERLPFAGSKDAGKRHVALTDLDRDGHMDVLVTEPAAARLVVHAGAPGGRLAGSRAWPSLLGASFPRVFDRDGDGLPEVVLAAPDEGAVALAEVDADGQLGFPRTLGAPSGDLLALDADPSTGAVWIIEAEGKGRRREYALRVLRDGDDDLVIKLEDVENDPSDLLLFDLNRDGLRDVIVFVPTERPIILVDGPADLQPVDANLPGLGILEGVQRDALFVGDVDGDGLDELLVPAGGFARAIALDADGRPEVVAQVNLDDPSAEVGAVAAADVDGDGTPEVVLVNASAGRLETYSLTDGAPRLAGRTDLLGLRPSRLLPVDLDGDGADDLLLVTDDSLSTCRAGGTGLAFDVVAEYESPVDGAQLDRLAVGDVNGDGGPDLVLTETRKHMLHVADASGETLRHALKWPVFESRLFEGSRRSSREPRELLVADVSGDGLHDIALIVHDRVLVYTQEPAP